MSSIEYFFALLKNGLNTPPEPVMANRVQLIHGYDASAKYNILTVIFRTTKELTRKIEEAEPYTYPGQLLINSLNVFHAVLKSAKKGRLDIYSSELMTGVFAMCSNIESMFGANLTDDGWFTVPHVDLRVPSANTSSDADQWRQALLVRDWPGLFKEPFREGTPMLRVVHLPEGDAESLSDEILMKVERMTLGWNFANLCADVYFRTAAETLRTYAKEAETIVTVS